MEPVKEYDFSEPNFLFLTFEHEGSTFVADTEFVIFCTKSFPDFITEYKTLSYNCYRIRKTDYDKMEHKNDIDRAAFLYQTKDQPQPFWLTISPTCMIVRLKDGNYKNVLLNTNQSLQDIFYDPEYDEVNFVTLFSDESSTDESDEQ